ncbi:arginine--tRNA ligase [Xanthocytophaga agilis]|uniref:Arginine--tRNA ligase n=1 Tax=Xanthocytophaga agilis TaxID=3048010 RepID=A0AAE3UE82_9BACT|nr:arginine--tRNA ligase [Xanthocytophaga agilis]MDJ1499233.1 arginine--tRNA ligase [Xanthocytophaga agilis]
MALEQTLQTQISQALSELFSIHVPSEEVLLQATRKDFEGSHTFVTFQIAKQVRKSPVEVGQQLGDYLQQKGTAVSRFNVVQGFLNLVLSDAVWIELFKSIQANTSYGFQPANGQKVMVEYSSPNTNKPLHLGHLRNNFLGYSIAQILKANGYEVMKTNIVNDRGIHICKSMLAYQKFGNGETPESSNMKGDKLVGKYYVEFDKQLKNQTQPFLQEAYNQTFTSYSEAEQTVIKKSLEKIEKLEGFVPPLKAKIDKTQLNTELAELITEWETGLEKTSSIIKELETVEGLKGAEKELLATLRKINKLEGEINDEKDEIKGIAQNKTEIMKEAQQMLLKWEQGDPETVALWKKMNGWVYVGFDVTYKRMGVDFDKFYYESNTYLLGKEIVNEGLEKGIFFKKENGSVWIDLTEVGLDEKLLLRGDGTSVYMTQDLGLADLKHTDFPMDKSVYVVGNEQDYHFKVLFSILQKLGRPYAEGLYHLSYGMVDLPSGKMKSREGTVVDADDLMNEMVETAEERSKDLSKVEEFPEEERTQLFNMVGIGALKYFLLKVDPVKRMLFNPDKSIDLHGNTATFIQYTHARISTIVRKSQEFTLVDVPTFYTLHEAETDLVILLGEFPNVIKDAGNKYAPSTIANYCYEMAKSYNRFFDLCSIFKADTPEQMSFRVALSAEVGKVIKKGMNLLGIQVPDRM